MEIPAVGAVITDDQGQVLLVLRGHAPARGRWSLPGGRVEAGEAPARALVREVLEETGLRIEVGGQLGQVTIPIDADSAYAVTDFRCRVLGGTLRAGDDAADVQWFSLEGLADVATTNGLTHYLTKWMPSAKER